MFPEWGSDKMSELISCLLLAVLLISGLWAVRKDKEKNDGGGK